MVLISGEAGIGKSRLAEEFLEKALKTNCTILTGNCLPGMPLPYLPFMEAFKEAIPPKGLEKVPPSKEKVTDGKVIFGDPFVCGDDDSKQVIDATWSPDRILFSVLEFVKSKSRLRPLIIRIEDLQWADAQSIQLLHFLARNACTEKLLILGTYRSEEIIPIEGRPNNSLFDVLRLMRREGLVEEIELKGLHQEEVGELVQDVLGSKANDEVVGRVAGESEGNPLYAIETIKILEETRSIKIVGGEWMIVPGKRFEIPPTIKEIVLRRLESLTKEQRRILDIASVIGYRFDVDTLKGVSNVQPIPLIDDLDKLEGQFELILEIADGYQFRHHLFRQITYDSISAAKRSEYHRMVGELLENKVFPEKSALLALHFFEAKDNFRYVKYAICTGEEFVAKGAASQAIPFFKNTLDIIKGRADENNDFIRVKLGLAHAYIQIGNFDDAEVQIEELIASRGVENLDARTLRYLAEISLLRGKIEKVSEQLNKAEDAASEDPNELAEIRGTRANLFLWQGNFGEAERSYLDAISASKKAGNDDLTARLYCYLGDVYLTQGKVEKALTSVDEAFHISNETPGFYGEMEACYYSGMVYFHIGDWREAIERLRKSIDIGKKIGQLVSNCWSGANLSLVYDSIGDHKTALIEARKGLEAAREIQSPYAMLLGLSSVFHSCLRNDLMDEAKPIYDEAVNIEKGISWSLHSTTRCFFMAAKGEFLARLMNGRIA